MRRSIRYPIASSREGGSHENNLVDDNRRDVFDGAYRVLVLYPARLDGDRLSENDLWRCDRHDHYGELPAG